jgi:hypothetical protein
MAKKNNFKLPNSNSMMGQRPIDAGDGIIFAVLMTNNNKILLSKTCFPRLFY